MLFALIHKLWDFQWYEWGKTWDPCTSFYASDKEKSALQIIRTVLCGSEEMTNRSALTVEMAAWSDSCNQSHFGTNK